MYCVFGKESRNDANVTCRSCIKQEVTCPFPFTMETKPAVGQISTPEEKPVKCKKRKEPNKTEAAYGRLLSMEFPTARIRYEEITLHLDNGHSYTADWVVTFPDGKMLFVEVKARGKNGFRHGSYQRARCMFDQCQIEYPHWTWRWAEKCAGSWDVK